jgi:hypothetical protein
MSHAYLAAYDLKTDEFDMDEFTDGEKRQPGDLIELPVRRDPNSPPLTTLSDVYPGYSVEVANRLCNAIITSTKSLSEICASSEDFPSPTQFIIWASEIPEFQQAVAAARILQADHCAWETVRVLEEIEESANPACYAADVSKAKALSQNFRWLAGQIDPMRWGRMATPIEAPKQTARKMAGDMSEAEALQYYLSATTGE